MVKALSTMRTVVLLALHLAALRIAAAQHSLLTTNYYSVTGSTVREIQQSLDMARRRATRSAHDGTTDWRVEWRFSALPSGSICRLSTFSTTTKITITLPRWVAPTNASEAVATEWQRYIRALEEHEHGHARFALAAAAEIHRRIKEAGSDSNCETLRQRVNTLCQSIVQTHKQWDAAYDQHTNHGTTQGARLRHGARPQRNPF